VGPWAIAGFIAVMLLAQVVGGVAAYGSSILALPALVWLTGDVKWASTVLILCATSQNFHLAYANRASIDRPTVRALLGWIAVGLPIGVLVANWLPQKGLMWALAVVLVVSGLLPFLAPRREKPGSKLGAGLLTLLGGVIHGAFATGGGPVTVAMRMTVPEKNAFRATMFAFWAIVNVVVIALFAVSGRVTWDSLLWGLGSIPVVVVGNFWGQRLAQRLSQRQFEVVVSVLLVLAGLITGLRNL